MNAKDITTELIRLANPEIAAHSQRFFKTGPGEYGEGDRFLGIRVPALRRMAKAARAIDLPQAATLVRSPFHEVRLCGLLILVEQFRRADDAGQKAIYDCYLEHTPHINNWDLVDASAPAIIGGHLMARSRRPLHRLARSADLWERRIAIMATLTFIKAGDFGETLKIAERLLGDDEDLIHKATGWMLREIGNRDRHAEEAFLQAHYRQMPRTMLRYAIERLPERRRQQYLKGRI